MESARVWIEAGGDRVVLVGAPALPADELLSLHARGIHTLGLRTFRDLGAHAAAAELAEGLLAECDAVEIEVEPEHGRGDGLLPDEVRVFVRELARRLEPSVRGVV